MKRREAKKWEEKSKYFDKEFSGSIENTEPLRKEDREWLKDVLKNSDEPKIPITIRLSKWQIVQAKKLAAKKHIRGYQTFIRQLLSEALVTQD